MHTDTIISIKHLEKLERLSRRVGDLYEKEYYLYKINKSAKQ